MCDKAKHDKTSKTFFSDLTCDVIGDAEVSKIGFPWYIFQTYRTPFAFYKSVRWFRDLRGVVPPVSHLIGTPSRNIWMNSYGQTISLIHNSEYFNSVAQSFHIISSHNIHTSTQHTSHNISFHINFLFRSQRQLIQLRWGKTSHSVKMRVTDPNKIKSNRLVYAAVWHWGTMWIGKDWPLKNSPDTILRRNLSVHRVPPMTDTHRFQTIVLEDGFYSARNCTQWCVIFQRRPSAHYHCKAVHLT